MIRITNGISINEHDIQEEFIRASGPGGQNVNKVATAVQLRFEVRHSSLPADVRKRLAHLAGRRMTENEVLIIDARRFRTREHNRQDALERLVTLIRKAAKRPKPRRKTKPTFASRQRRLEHKHRRAKIKKMRRFDGRSEE